MPRKLRKLKITEISSVDRGAGDNCQIVLRKAAGDGHAFNLIVHRDAEGRGTLRLADVADMAKHLGVKAKKLLKVLNAPPPAPEPDPTPVTKVLPMPPKPPARETFYSSLCKYAASKARPDETEAQAFARVATTDPLGQDLMVAAKVADVTSNRANFWPKPLPKEPDKAVVEPTSLHAYERLMAEAKDYAAANNTSEAVAFERVSQQNPSLFAIAKGYGPLFAGEDEEADPEEAEPDDDEDDEVVTKICAAIKARHQGHL